MRVPEEIQVEGNFWLPEAPERKVTGRLSVKDNAEIRLEILGAFKDWAAELTGGYQLDRIVGEVEKYGHVTLDQCMYERKNRTGGIAKGWIVAQFLFLGAAYNPGVAPVFNSCAFEVDGLDEWHGLTGLKVEMSLVEQTANIAYRRPDEIRLWTGPGMTLALRFGWQPPGVPVQVKAGITQTSYLYLRSEVAQPLDHFAAYAHKLTNLLTLAADQTVTIRDVRVTSAALKESGPGGREYERTIQVFFQALSFTETPAKIKKHQMLFYLADLQRRSQEAIDAWLQAHRRLMPAMNLYFSAKAGVHEYLDSRFLALAQALETYHRRSSEETVFPPGEYALLQWAVVDATSPDYQKFVKGRLGHGNEPSLSKRLEAMFGEFGDLFGSRKARESLVYTIVSTRNYFTHYDPKLENQVPDGAKLWRLCLMMEALLQLLCLKELRFTPEVIREVAARHQGIQHKLKA